MYYVGLMSGTSADAIDAVVLQIPPLGQPTIKATYRHPLPDNIRQAVLALTQSGPDELERAGHLHISLGRLFAQAANAVIAAGGLSPRDIRAVGSHGQTLRHRPDGDSPFTLQVTDAATIAHSTGITTVADFRSADMAAGGQGAPLVPAFHREMFRSAVANRAIVNIGGVANVTFLPASDEAVLGFDTGPGNTLLDNWIRRERGMDFDRDGAWAATGKADATFVELLLADPFFNRPPPKSTGPDYFNLAWLKRRESGTKLPRGADMQAALVLLTAKSIANGLGALARLEEVYVCGGGSRNPVLMNALKKELPTIPVADTSQLGLAAEWVEAAAFAWLAHRALEGLPGNLPSVTGARAAVVLGAIYPTRSA